MKSGKSPSTRTARKAPSARVLAMAEGRPAALLVSLLALRRHLGADTAVSLRLVASGPRLDVVKRLAAALRGRGVEVAVETFPGWRTFGPREAAFRRRCREAAAAEGSFLVVDVSACGPEGAVRSHAIAREEWAGPFVVASFDEGRGTTRLCPVPARGETPGGGPDVFSEIDIGSPADVEPLGARAVTPEEVLGLIGIGLVHEDPYGLPGGETGANRARLVTAARGVLQAFLETGPEYARFRQVFARVSRGRDGGPKDVVLSRDDVPDAMIRTFEVLWELGLASPRDAARTAWQLAGPVDRGGLFFLAGGWLELLVAHTLERSFRPARKVERNAGTVWGAKRSATSAYAEADAVFVHQSRLHVVSCKNEFREESVLRHVDRFRALVAEYGEAMVRPVLVSTTPVEGTLAARCRAYEIGQVSGPALLEMLSLDAADAVPYRFLRAIVGASPGPPAPGMTGG